MLSHIDLNRDLSLYVHIPFCTKKCSYCAFFSRCNIDDFVIDSYVNKLCSEIQEVKDYYQRPFSTVFIGGGNPGLLKKDQLLKLCKTIGIADEFTIECNPENVNEHLYDSLEFVNRISIGVQSLDEKLLKKLGRNSDLNSTIKGINESQILRDRFKTKINYDLICCVPRFPNENVVDWHQDRNLERLFSMASFDHLSLYSLTVEEKTIMENLVKKGELIELSEDEQVKELLLLWEKIEDRGFEHYEVSNFAKNEDSECKHNLNYWRLNQYIGLGCSAASTLFNPYARIEATANIKEYVNNSLLSTYSIEELSQKEQIEEYLLMSLRTKYGINKTEFKRRFGFEVGKLQFIDFIDSKEYFKPNQKGYLIADAAVDYCLDTLFDRQNL